MDTARLRRAGRRLAGAAVAAALLNGVAAVTLATPASAYTLLANFWRDPAKLTYCFQMDREDGHEPLPAEYTTPVNSAAAAWNDTPTPVVFSATACSAATEIKAYGVRLGADGSGGSGGCVAYAADYRGHKRNECVAGSGFVEINLDIPIKGHPRYFHFLGLHELGHVVGLGHADNAPCHNRCWGPVMSYGSCPSEDRCVTVVATDDINGVNDKYHYKPSSSTSNGGGGSGGGTCFNGGPNDLGETNVAAVGGRDALTMADAADHAVRRADDLQREWVEWTGAGDAMRELAGQDPLAVYDAVNGTAGKVLWNVNEAVSLAPENC